MEGLAYGPTSVEVYNPRQQRELEANVFAAAFLLPPDELREHFLAGLSFAELAERFRVSPTATLNALATHLLLPAAVEAVEPGPARTLDPSQQDAATVPAGPTLVSAGPGTGKTSTLIGRIVHLLETGHPARQILAVTFSNRAAQEVRDRIALAAPARAHELTVTTFHAFCLDFLRRYHAVSATAG